MKIYIIYFKKGIESTSVYEGILVNTYTTKINIKIVKIYIKVQYATQLTFIEMVYIDCVFTR